MIRTSYFYSAAIIGIHDGDTLHLNVKLKRQLGRRDSDLGFSVYVENGWLKVHEDFRLMGLNCAELSTDSGKAALDYLDRLLRIGVSPGTYVPITIQTVKEADHEKQEKFGRWLATVWIGQGFINPTWDTSVNERLIKSGHAAPWDGNGPPPIPSWPIP